MSDPAGEEALTSGQDMIDTAVQMLIDAQEPSEGRAVIDWLRTTFVDPKLAKGAARSVASLNGTLTRVRAALKLRGVQPPSLRTFRLNEVEALELKRQQEQSQRLKNENLIVIDDARALYKTLESLLETARPTMPFPRLILPLLLCSGRRLTEICSPRSTIGRVEGHPFCCRFTGLLKKKTADCVGLIPLLVPYALFAAAFAALRTKQMDDQPRDRRRAQTSVTQLSNESIKRRYGHSTNMALAARAVLPLPTYHCYKRGKERACHDHDLRALYAALVYLLYDCSESYCRTTMRVLVHATLQESLSYSHIRLEGGELLRGALGPLCTDLLNASPVPPATCCHDSIAESLSYSHVHLEGCEDIRDTLGPLLKSAPSMPSTARPPSEGAGTD